MTAIGNEGLPPSLTAQLISRVNNTFADYVDTSHMSLIEPEEVSPYFDVIMSIPKKGGGLFGRNKGYLIVSAGRVSEADSLIGLMEYLSEQKGKFDVFIITYGDLKLDYLTSLKRPKNVEGLAIATIDIEGSPKLITMDDLVVPSDMLMDLAEWLSERMREARKRVGRRATRTNEQIRLMPRVNRPVEGVSFSSITEAEERANIPLTYENEKAEPVFPNGKSYLEPTPNEERESGQPKREAQSLESKRGVDLERIVRKEIIKLKVSFVKGKVDLNEYRKRLKDLQDKLTLVIKFSKILKEKGVEGLREKKEELRERLKVLEELKKEGYTEEDLSLLEKTIREEMEALEELERDIISIAPTESTAEVYSTPETEDVEVKEEPKSVESQREVGPPEIDVEAEENEFEAEILRRLEKMYKEGRISKEMYDKLKRKYESI